jgi:hypothetical protein
MNHYHLPIIFLIAASVVCTADAQETNRNSWHANASILDETAKHADPVMRDAARTLAHDVNSFYQLLQDKQWHKTYELRAKVFRETVRESDYLAEAINAEKLWGLVSYDVLSGEFRNSYGSTNVDEAILICKFTELPDYAVSYSTVWWHKEDGVWKCLSAGPRKLSIFREVPLPFVDWR